MTPSQESEGKGHGVDGPGFLGRVSWASTTHFELLRRAVGERSVFAQRKAAVRVAFDVVVAYSSTERVSIRSRRSTDGPTEVRVIEAR